VKQFITSGKTADIAIVFAVTDKGAGKKGNRRFRRADLDTGYIVARLEEKTGQHASDTAQIVLETAGSRQPTCLARKVTATASPWPTSNRAHQHRRAAVGMARAALEAASPMPRNARPSARR